MSLQYLELPKNHRELKTVKQQQEQKMNRCLLVPKGVKVNIAFKEFDFDYDLPKPKKNRVVEGA